MSAADWALALSVFLSCAVEAVEAFTIVLAMGLTRGWRSSLYGAAAAGVTLVAIVAALGPAVGALPVNALRIVIGSLLLVFGLQWLRKAILRAGGVKALHDEAAIFASEAARARDAGEQPAGAIDGYALAITFKAVLLEGVEVAFIVVTFGANQHRLGVAALAAVAAIVLVIAGGVLVRAPLARVPENTMKFVVGIMLTSFGTFWSAEGAGAHWPGGDASLPVLIVMLAAASLLMAQWLRRRPAATPRAAVGQP